MLMLSPGDFTRLEEILLLAGLVAAAAWFLVRRARRRPAREILAGDGVAPVQSRPVKYHPALVAIHWFVAFAMANLLLRGALIMRYIPNDDPAKIDGLRAHLMAGVLVLALMLIRILLRVGAERPPRATAGNRHLDRLARISHMSLYILVIAQALSGLFMAFQTGVPDVVFFGQGALPPDFWAFPVRSVHYLVSRLLMACIALHLCGALYHTLFLKDGLLRRMSFGGRLSRKSKLVGLEAGN